MEPIRIIVKARKPYSEWSEERKEKQRASSKRWTLENPDKKHAYDKKWRDANKEHKKKVQHEWYLKNKEKVAEYSKQRRARIKAEKEAEKDWTCVSETQKSYNKFVNKENIKPSLKTSDDLIWELD